MTEERHWWWHRPFLYAGRMDKNKGVSTIIWAWLTLKHWYKRYCPQLWLAGGTPDEIERIRADFGIVEVFDIAEREGHIQWWGYLDPPGLSALLTRACALIMHSRYEPGGRVVIEAMAQGVPVIATPYGFAKDLVRDWHNGFLVNYGDQETLACRMAHFAQQPLLRNSLGATAQETVQTALSKWRFIETHCLMYDKAAGQLSGPTLTDEVRPDRKILNYFGSRRIIPTYPHTSQEPEINAVRGFAENHIGCEIDIIQRIEDGPGSSTRWLLSSDGGQWIVKWPYPRLALRPLWDPLYNGDLLTAAEDRFARELFSATLPCFAKWTATDADKLLLLRTVYSSQKQTIDPGVFVEISQRYKELYRYPLPPFTWAADLERDWNVATVEEVTEFQNIVRDDLKKTPWYPNTNVSVRLAWRIVVLGLERSRGPLAHQIKGDYLKHIYAFSKLAEAEEGLNLCATHGSGDLAHCLRAPDGRLMFIDGENTHPAQPGEDMAATLFYAIADAGHGPSEKQVWPGLLEAVAADRDEVDLLLAWIGLLAWEDLRKQAVMLRENRQASMARWETLAEIALSRLTR